RVPVDEVHLGAEAPSAAGALVRRDAGQQARVPDPEPAREGRLRAAARGQARALLRDDPVLEDAAGAMRERQERLRAGPEVGRRLDADHRVRPLSLMSAEGGPETRSARGP